MPSMTRHKRIHDSTTHQEDGGAFGRKRNRVEVITEGNESRKVSSPSCSSGSDYDDTKGHFLGGRGDIINDRCT